MDNKQQPICLVAGLSGGHLLPVFALATAMRKDGTVPVILFSATTALDHTIVKHIGGIDTHYTLGINRLCARRWYTYPFALLALAKDFAQSWWRLRKVHAQCIITTGGLIAVPVCLAGWLLGIPITVYELNALPGRAVSFLAGFAMRLCICFESARMHFSSANQEKIVHVDYPIRFSTADKLTSLQARTQLGLAPTAKILLIVGGSQGSQFLNAVAQAYLRYRMLMLAESDQKLIVFHQAGQAQQEEVEQFYKNYGIAATVFSYKADIAVYYAAADVVIARAGAGTVFELAFFDKKSIIIPLEGAAAGHQVHNALAIAAQYPHLFTVYRQESIEKSPSELYSYLDSLLSPA